MRAFIRCAGIVICGICTVALVMGAIVLCPFLFIAPRNAAT